MLLRKTFRHSRGFTLIELAIVLGVIGVLAAGLWRLMSAGSQQTKDQTTAQQQQALIAAVTGYMGDTSATGGQTLLTALGPNATLTVSLPASNTSIANCQANIVATETAFCNYLPPGFYSGTTNPYGQTFNIQALKDGSAAGVPPGYYSFMILTSTAPAGAVVIPDADGGRISSLIGGDGGFIFTAGVCGGATTYTACGNLNAWSIANVTLSGPLGGYGFGASQSGTVASRTFASAGTSSSNFWLARIPVPGDASFTDNTMTTNQYMSNASLYMYPFSGPGATANNIFMNDGEITFNVGASGGIQLNNAAITGVGNVTGAQLELLMPAATAGSQPLIVLSEQCTSLSTAGCNAAISITNGDINVNGEITTVKLFASSDARFKTNIHPLKDALSNIMKLGPVSYNLKASGSPSMGVIAQNVETVYPELVLNKDGMKYVDYNGLIAPLIGAVQELKRENDELREQLRLQAIREERLENDLRAKIAAP